MHLPIVTAGLVLAVMLALWICKPVAEQLWVLDSVPGKVIQDNTDGEVEKVLQTLQSLPSTLPSRK